MKKIIFSLVLVFSFTSAFAQWDVTSTTNNTTSNIGINSSSTNSMLSVNTPGDANHIISSFSPSLAHGSAALRADAASAVGFADHVAGLFSTIEAGSGYTYGVRSSAYTNTSSNAGRAYGVWGQAGNATTGTNFGVYGRLLGSNSGAAIIGVDDINHGGWGGILPTTDTWAGYFLGDVQVTNNIGVQSVNAPQSMIAANTVGDSRHVISAYSTSASSGAAGLYAEAAQGNGADHVSAVFGNIESGAGYTYGVRGNATTTAPSNAGRAYGVWGRASNATAGTNFGVWGELTGSNGGTAILGYDRIKDGGAWGGILPTTDTYAGFFYGDTHVTDRMGIGSGTLCLNALEAAAPNPGYRLFVDGGIASKELFVSNGLPWCDYVFEADYELTSLEDVEKHIQEKGHLHKIESAKKIDGQGGFEVGKITVNQQEKIEEIFLHLIEMNKKIETLEAENQALKTQIATQK